MSSRLSDTSYAVLGLLDRLGPSTPYQLKQEAQSSLFHFWTIPHTQIYSESARLAGIGLLEERQEQTGRRRRTYQLTSAGRAELDRWRKDPDTGPRELRDPALLKLFCGAEPAALGQRQAKQHQDLLEQYLAQEAAPRPDGARQALQAGIDIERAYARFWSEIANSP